MTFEDDEGAVDIPAEMFDEEERATLAPVFAGYDMQAELIRSVLEGSGIPAVVFGPGYRGDVTAMPGGHRVMVRATDVEAALDTIRNAEVSDGEIVTPTSDDLEVMVDEDYEETGYDEPAPGDWTDAQGVPVLAGGSDWGPRIVGLIGIAALAIAIVVLLAKAT